MSSAAASPTVAAGRAVPITMTRTVFGRAGPPHVATNPTQGRKRIGGRRPLPIIVLITLELLLLPKATGRLSERDAIASAQCRPECEQILAKLWISNDTFKTCDQQ